MKRHVPSSNPLDQPTTQQTPTPPFTPGVQTISFNELEDELFGAAGTPEREEYESALAFEMIPSTIKAYRLEHKLTQAELGERVGVQKAQISKLERSASNVTLDTLRRVFGAMNTTVKIQLLPTH